MRKNIEHLMNFFTYIKEHLLCFILIVAFFILAGIVLVNLPINNPENIEAQQILICGVSLENWSIWYTFVGLIITALWSMYQYTKNIARKQQERGAEIAKLFAHDLLNKCTILGKVILKSGIGELFKLEELDYRVFKNFDRDEIFDIYGKDELILTKLRRLLFSQETQEIYIECLKENINLNNTKDSSNITDYKEIFILDNSNMPVLFSQLVSLTLNELEYISMYIASQAAGSKYVYQSLHQIFLRTIKLLAPIIALQNKDYSDKYYTNIIFVYNEWAELRQIGLKREKKNKEKANKILNPKIKTV